MGNPHSSVFVDVATDIMDISEDIQYTVNISSFLNTAMIKQQYEYHYHSLSNSAIGMQFSADPDNHKYSPYQHESVPWSLIGTIIFTTGCFYTYYLTVCRYSRYPLWYIFPMISFCGCYAVEQPLWKATFILAGIGQFMAQITLTDTQLYKRFLIHSPAVLRGQSKFWLALHAFASSMVGIFPLTIQQCQESISYINNPQIEPKMDYTAIPHYIFAAVAGGGGVIGVIIGLFIYFYAFKYAECNGLEQMVDIQTLKRFFIFRIICAVIMLLGLIGITVIGPIAVFFKGYLSGNMANFMSLCEWILCIPMGLYDGCISLENYYVVEYINDAFDTKKK